ncbi:PREDICTED: G-type lectin S-receptor-like serine/threonine-protein kinase At1g67520 isoform X2 [Ipomoea nil]|uniref:G-type lectin S-receptor-like serine/threonine-protein kinase At1g67520 isoform X2 n=1 Tax=Ipomoea nil TaxID=35883 RepID=UPI0009009224|nr:PREDICTED: G-type lectin S-receptor-like serine/threonine-protein kinase At1g67520 isoform X2 [Ipomoea nil]
MEWMNDNVVMEEVVFFLLILCSLPSIASSLQSDTLHQGDVLNASDESDLLVSANENYTLGFFMPERTKRTYLAIRPYSGSDNPVWIGNRDAPLPANSSASLQIDASGRLLILTHDEGQGNSYLISSKKTSLNVTATLLDSGNLVLREVNTDGSFGEELWSSFDNPTDTLLPGMKLGVDRRTGRNWALRSWKDDDIPAAGAFSLEWEPSKRRLVIKYRGVVHWTSGELMNATDFQHIGGTTNYFVNISTKEEEYFSCLPTLNPHLPLEFRQGWRLEPLGILNISSDTGSIMDLGDCNGFENETLELKGCELWEQPKCRDDGQTFEERSGKFVYHAENGVLPIQSIPIYNSSYNISDCREYCWNNCDCVGYRSNSERVCECWMGTFLQFEEGISIGNSGNTEYVYVLNRPAKGKSRIKKWICRILIPTAISLLLLGLLVLWWRRTKQEKARKEQELKDLLTLDDYTDIHELNNGENVNIKVFSYEWIVDTTNNFSLNCKLGQGGFGAVYKGITPEGQEVAIKQLSEKSKQGIVEFKNEVVLIAKLQHTNLVKLLGFCIHKDQKMLIYEFMPNKSLDFYLFDPNPIGYLSWKRRLNIIEGTAQGLLYLHKYSRVRIIHRDMKVSNILLDENMNPKISDFGIAKILKQNVTEANTMRLVGTFGYMAPEYVLHGVFSMKSDVYSFGVLLLEIVSGKKNNGFRSEDGPLNLVEHAWELWNKDAVLQLVDPSLISNNLCGNEEQLRRCINVGLICVEDSAVDRPPMDDVVSMLTNENLALPKPKKPAFVSRFNVGDTFQDGQSRKFTVNELSTSTMEAR